VRLSHILLNTVLLCVTVLSMLKYTVPGNLFTLVLST